MDSQNIKTRDKTVGKREAQRSDCFVSTGACHNPFVAVDHPAAATKSTEKFHVLDKRHIRKPSSVDERRPPAENSMIAASHPEHKPRIMREAVRQSVNNRRRQTNAKETAADCWILHHAVNLIQTSPWHFGVCMQEPENIAPRHAGAGVHLYRAAAFAAPNELMTEPRRKLIRAVGACAIDHDDFRASRSLAQMLEKRAYQRRLIQNRNND